VLAALLQVHPQIEQADFLAVGQRVVAAEQSLVPKLESEDP
jgi:hypothetical protein